MNTHGFCELGFAKLDMQRQQRRGFAEVIYCPGKRREHLREICRVMLRSNQPLLLTRLDKSVYAYLKKSFPRLRYNQTARIGYAAGKKRAAPVPAGMVLIVSAGTADIPVAEEAAVTLEVLGGNVTRLFDVGVAGVHRLLTHVELLRSAACIIVVAGMEGALASIVSGLVAVPVIAVPTSCGYGASFQGLSALLTMLNGCSPGVAVVNIDNGFGAGYMARMICK